MGLNKEALIMEADTVSNNTGVLDFANSMLTRQGHQEAEEIDILHGGSDEESTEKSDECDLPPICDEPDEDFFAENITSEDFARCLNLVPAAKLKDKHFKEHFKSTFPLRLITRTKALCSDAKFPEDIPITSNKGLKILQNNEQKNFYSKQTIEMRIKSYETFSSIQTNSLFNHPNLRNRDKKDYPICFSSKNSECATARTYAFTKRQRMENLVTIKTGLNTRSRKLLLSCNKRLAVNIKRLPDDEIKSLMQKRAKFGPITAELIKGEDSSLMGSDSDATVIEQNTTSYIDLCSDDSSESSDNDDDPSYKCKVGRSNFQGVLKDNSSPIQNRCGQSPKQLRNYFEMYGNSCVVLRNVLHSIRRYRGDYYVVGTNIKVPFLENYLKSLDPKKRRNLVFPEARLIVRPRFDHAYHRPFSTVVNKKTNFLPNNCLNHRKLKTKIDIKTSLNGSSHTKSKSLKPDAVKSSNSLKKQMNKTVGEVQIIPIIDLTASPPNSPPKKPKENNFSLSTFRCYNCGYNCRSNNPMDVKLLAFQHLRKFHCVPNPRSFLNVVNNTGSATVLEGFPGHKPDAVG